ncbi:MAG: LamG domain-containing protein [Candidatus Omnitrophota bacterium]
MEKMRNGIAGMVLAGALVFFATSALAAEKAVVAGPFTPDKSTLFLMHFDEGTGQVAGDSSVNKNDGKLVDTDWEKQGRFGSAVAFHGESGFIRLGSISKTLDLGTGDFTIEAWIKGNSFKSECAIFADGAITYIPGIFLFVSSRGDGMVRAQICFSPGGSENNVNLAGAATVVTTGEWHHVALVVKRSSSMAIYLDGKENGKIDISAKAGASLSNNEEGYIGAWGNNPGWNSFDGLIDELRLSNIARYESEFEVKLPEPK